jgi:hypothetical protein
MGLANTAGTDRSDKLTRVITILGFRIFYRKLTPPCVLELIPSATRGRFDWSARSRSVVGDGVSI